MRYYLYLDKPFLRSIYSAIGDINFDIDIVEFTSQKSYSTTNDVCLQPRI